MTALDSHWPFEGGGPDRSSIVGPLPLAKRGMALPSRPGLYLVTAGDCLAHVGTSSRLRGRVAQLARLGTHGGSAEVLCASYCTGATPLVWWEELPDATAARAREKEFKTYYGEPPVPRPLHARCRNGERLKEQLLRGAGEDVWATGYIEAIFAVGSTFRLLFGPRFERIWRCVGKPPGPWTGDQ